MQGNRPFMKFLRSSSVGLLAILAMVSSAPAADANRPTLPSRPNVTAPNNGDIQKLIDQFKTGRDKMLADRQAFLDQLKNATGEQRKQIVEKMQAWEKDMMESQRALGKQIRDEMRKLRQSTPGPGRR